MFTSSAQKMTCMWRNKGLTSSSLLQPNHKQGFMTSVVIEPLKIRLVQDTVSSSTLRPVGQKVGWMALQSLELMYGCGCYGDGANEIVVWAGG